MSTIREDFLKAAGYTHMISYQRKIECLSGEPVWTNADFPTVADAVVLHISALLNDTNVRFIRARAL